MERKAALVLSSGGARGIAHIGVIAELERCGYTISSLAGSSMGSLVGGMYLRGSLPAFTEWLLRFTRMDMFRFLDLSVGQGGFVKGEKILKAIGGFIGDVNIEDLPLPYACVASDLNGHREVVFREGSLLKAIRASISIPTVFLPVVMDSMLLVDGGVLNPLPLDLVQRTPGDLLIAVNVNSEVPYESPVLKPVDPGAEHSYGRVRTVLNEKWAGMLEQYSGKSRVAVAVKPKQANLFDVISDSINLAQNKIAGVSIEKHPPDILINVSFKAASVFDYYRSEELIAAGAAACRKAIAIFENR
jgi:NTE family protein